MRSIKLLVLMGGWRAAKPYYERRFLKEG